MIHTIEADQEDLDLVKRLDKRIVIKRIPAVREWNIYVFQDGMLIDYRQIVRKKSFPYGIVNELKKKYPEFETSVGLAIPRIEIYSTPKTPLKFVSS